MTQEDFADLQRRFGRARERIAGRLGDGFYVSPAEGPSLATGVYGAAADNVVLDVGYVGDLNGLRSVTIPSTRAYNPAAHDGYDRVIVNAGHLSETCFKPRNGRFSLGNVRFRLRSG